ncbi:uncharacterized protein LOC136040565 isoform X1 [Artemia franciscana]|uniref:uncharacterized protein LOC136040565 isoform X1 n=2 Tax=Artemia franciscana TaxID=6661 RepID=UPI0032DBACAA
MVYSSLKKEELSWRMSETFEAKDEWNSRLDYMLDDLQRTVSPKPERYPLVTQRKITTGYENSDRDSPDIPLLTSTPSGIKTETRIYKEWSTSGSEPAQQIKIPSREPMSFSNQSTGNATRNIHSYEQTVKSGSNLEKIPQLQFGGVGSGLDEILKTVNAIDGNVSTVQNTYESPFGAKVTKENQGFRQEVHYSTSGGNINQLDFEPNFGVAKNNRLARTYITTRSVDQPKEETALPALGVEYSLAAPNQSVQHFSETRRQQQRTVVKTYQYEQQYMTSGSAEKTESRFEGPRSSGNTIEFNKQPIPVRRMKLMSPDELDSEIDVRATLSEDEYSTIKKSSKTLQGQTRQLDSPIEGQLCNIESHPDFPKYSRTKMAQDVEPLCTVSSHPRPMCNVEFHSGFPIFKISCPSAEEPYCNIEGPGHPKIMCNIGSHPEYPRFRAGTENERRNVCTVPNHPIAFCNLPDHPFYPRYTRPGSEHDDPFCNIEDHPTIKCNIPGHPSYPDFMPLGESQTEPICNITGHPTGRCNVKFHPDYPKLVGDNGFSTAPFCFIPSHPELLCNIQGHPEYPGYMTETDALKDPYCNVPGHPETGNCNIPTHENYPKYAQPAELLPGAMPFCNIRCHPKKLHFNCNISGHPDYPIYIPDDNKSPPVCDIPNHPELLCNVPKHLDYPKFSPGPPNDGYYVCNIPLHPIMECNIPYHPEYAMHLGTLSTIAPPKCTLPGHPSLLCNIPKHPDYPNHIEDEISARGPPICNIPGHPELLCNVPHHPDYPRLSARTPQEPFCNVPSHPLTTKPRLFKPGGGSPLPLRRTGSPEPLSQDPPKKLDDLLASLSPSPMPHTTSTPVPSPTLQPERISEPAAVKPVEVPKKKKETQPCSGAPVYYPQGDIFTGKEKPVSLKVTGDQQAAGRRGREYFLRRFTEFSPWRYFLRGEILSESENRKMIL